MSANPSNTPRTIDNIGLDASIRYAQDISTYDAGLIQDSSIGRQTEVTVIIPYKRSELDELLGSVREVRTIAIFTVPPNATIRGDLFTYAAAPRVDPDKQEQAKEKTAALLKSHKRHLESEEKEIKAQCSSINSGLDTLGGIDRNLSLATGKRNEFQKG